MTTEDTDKILDGFFEILVACSHSWKPAEAAKGIEALRQELSTLRQSRQARDREVFAAARETVETYQQEGGYSFNHHRHEKYKMFAEWEASQKK